MQADQLPAPETFLSADEQEFLKELKLEKRRAEWLAGRYAAKKLISLKTGISMNELSVTYDIWHRPLCGGHLVSITHSGGMAAAAFADGRLIGTDIEKIRPHSEAWKRECFHQSEIPGGTDDEAIKVWTLKESVLKALGLGLTVPLKSIDFSGSVPVYAGKTLERFENSGKPCLIFATFKICGWRFSAAVEVHHYA